MECSTEIIINLSEKQTIIELSQALTPYKADVYLINEAGGNLYEANVKSMLGLVTLRIKNGDRVKIRATGSDAQEAMERAVQYFS